MQCKVQREAQAGPYCTDFVRCLHRLPWFRVTEVLIRQPDSNVVAAYLTPIRADDGTFGAHSSFLEETALLC